MAPRWQTAWVTGASSGIGRELALKLAAGGTRVAVSARSAAKLAELQRLDGRIVPVPLDVTVPADVIAAHERIERDFGGLDLAVLNAGVWHPLDASRYDPAKALDSMAVNYGGIVNALAPLIPAMTSRGRGHIALVASVAGYRGLPQASAYAPSKAAVISLAEVLRLELPPHGIKVQVINPGFVETPMTAVNDFPMPYMIAPGDAADRILRGLSRDKFEIAFPWQIVTIMKVLRLLPYGAFVRIGRSILPGR